MLSDSGQTCHQVCTSGNNGGNLAQGLLAVSASLGFLEQSQALNHSSGLLGQSGDLANLGFAYIQRDVTLRRENTDPLLARNQGKNHHALQAKLLREQDAGALVYVLVCGNIPHDARLIPVKPVRGRKLIQHVADADRNGQSFALRRC